jgi:formylglycine-generating enzyme required for sulfatase activity
MGSPQEEVGRTDSVEGQEEIDLNQAFVISAHEVTRDEFYRALADLRAEVERLGAVRDEELIAPDAKCPAVAVSWYEAAAYCNWLSSREGIAEDQWCYVPNDRGVYASGMRVKENFLGLTGYRLPTEAEWEYACRAGSDASRYFGSATEFVGDYEWHMENAEFRTHIVGTKMPNPLGLFDMLGNVAEWCHDPFRPEYRLLDNDEEVVYDRQDRARRGLSFRSWPQDIRVAARPRSKPDSHLMNLGFRIARTWLCEESGGP